MQVILRCNENVRKNASLEPSEQARPTYLFLTFSSHNCEGIILVSEDTNFAAFDTEATGNKQAFIEIFKSSRVLGIVCIRTSGVRS